MNLFAGPATNDYRNHYHPKERAMSRKIILSLVARRHARRGPFRRVAPTP